MVTTSPNDQCLPRFGCHRCQGLHHFIRELSIDATWEIHTFEPNPSIDPAPIIHQLGLPVVLHCEAAWTHNGKLTFNQYGKDGTSQGSLVAETGGDKDYGGDFFDRVTVDCIDFHEFVQSFGDRDNVFIKMDIESSEFTVLPYMLQKGWPSNVRKMWIEFHMRDVPSMAARADQLAERILAHGTQVVRWI